MTDIAIEQAILSRSGSGCRVLARTPGFLEKWQADVERLAVGFGERPDGVGCHDAVFAQPLGQKYVAVVRVSDQEGEAQLAFHFLAIPRDAYRGFGGDPFVLAERVAPAWHLRGALPCLSWPAEPLPQRTVADVRKVLQQTKTAALLEGEEPTDAP
jgi:hypothetical protein